VQILRDLAVSGGHKGWKVQFFQHLITGIIATAAHYVVMWLILLVEISPAIATSIGFVAGATTRFLFSYYHIFEPERNWSTALPFFIFALAMQMGLNVFLLTVFISLNIALWPSQIITTILLTTFNFLVYRYWVFK
jgi:putative flippase GtrA